ncbi:hypothetical protein [Natrinema sp. DC36]|uniref:hypothetical protein n=1 Tax=Natrinema sp. DC36 TaxID=2878680 RepID=UPI001CF0BD2C|nr:hypothetical protein [Natrinema sp. DC36]
MDDNTVFQSLVGTLAKLLERANVIEQGRLIGDDRSRVAAHCLGLTQISKQAASVAIVGLVAGSPAITGLAFADVY